MEETKELGTKDLFADSIPANYVTVKLSSLGKLGLPAVVHVRDYTFDEAVLFGQANDNNEEDVVLQLIENVVYEKIDMSKVTSSDVLEILMTIQGTWYSPYIEKRYVIDESLPEDKKYEKENISTVEIPINKITTLPLKEGMKLPINISFGNTSIKMDYPRLNNIKIAKRYIEEKFAEQENRIEAINQKIKNDQATKEEYSTVAQLTSEKESEYLKVITALQLLEYNGTPLEGIEDKVKILKLIPISFIKKMNDVFENQFKFGIQNDVTFVETTTGKEITRRFDFRFVDFLSTLDKPNEQSFTVTFG